MKVADAGFFRWIAWALFSWNGTIKRLPYLGSFFCLVLVVRVYVSAAVQWLAVNVAPPPPGVELDAAYVATFATSRYIIPFLLPVCFIYLMLDVKRLRSIGLSSLHALGVALIFSGLTPFAPIAAPAFANMVVMTTFAYHAILGVIPAAEDRISPAERKYRTWRALATGDGTPRRLRGKDIKTWHIVRQGPKK